MSRVPICTHSTPACVLSNIRVHIKIRDGQCEVFAHSKVPMVLVVSVYLMSVVPAAEDPFRVFI